ncbi:hypothetical protein B5P45_03015 [Phyllobacterium zundukense]|uniref:Schlafen AlbA-2 domain-containing protein n=2 Tax=Phyllobacterium zundukense TaxID=1867719 RepID=A0A2N9W4W6_9HYPH|nr:hypothetical protein BLM14_09060 [Phyllobacterium zundukense]PIO46784.1 hypothetical protein B5P45_03015 [Phyllobacterium zundukense]
MAIERKFSGITAITKKWLAAGEGERVDFKRSVEGLQTDDLVAFANMKEGGTILLGVTEQAQPDGSQIGLVVGCDITDGAVLQILNKAISCIPPVPMKIFAENMADKPFLRVQVIASDSRPHSTPKGVYCRRDGSRNRPLHPTELLEIFLTNEGRVFAERFQESAAKIIDGLDDLEASLDKRIQSIGDQLGWAEFKVGDTEDTVDTILALVRGLGDDTADISSRLRSLFRQDNRDDPVRAKSRAAFLDRVKKQLAEDPDLVAAIRKGPVSLKVTGRGMDELDEKDVNGVISEAMASLGKHAATESE